MPLGGAAAFDVDVDNELGCLRTRRSFLLHQPNMADINLQEIHDFMVEIAKKVGERITSAKPTTGAAGSKKNCISSRPTAQCV